ncbi:MAG TPA: hypothetical protein VFZ52_23295 [Chryseolinea sp.]
MAKELPQSLLIFSRLRADLGAYFTWPREGSNIGMIAVVTVTGLSAMKSDANQYFAAGGGFPDYLIFLGNAVARRLELLKLPVFLMSRGLAKNSPGRRTVRTRIHITSLVL